MALPPELREKVRAAYVYQRLSLEVAALQADVSLRTAQSWRKKAEGTPEDWDTARAAAGMSSTEKENMGRELLDNFLIMFKTTQQNVLNLPTSPDPGEALKTSKAQTEMMASLAYTFERMTGSLKRLMPEVNRAVIANEIVELLVGYIKREYPDSLPIFVKILGGFSKELVANAAREAKRK